MPPTSIHTLVHFLTAAHRLAVRQIFGYLYPPCLSFPHVSVSLLFFFFSLQHERAVQIQDGQLIPNQLQCVCYACECECVCVRRCECVPAVAHPRRAPQRDFTHWLPSLIYCCSSPAFSFFSTQDFSFSYIVAPLECGV